MRNRAASLALIISLLGVGCTLGSVPTDVPVLGTGTKVLFIGNSYLYFNDIPGMVQAIADSANGEEIAFAIIASPNLALIDHWKNGNARQTVRADDWTWVILQQGPSSVDLNRDTLRIAAKLFADEVAVVKGKTALFSAWPAADRAQDFDRAIESYALAAADVNGTLLPVAAAWVSTMKKNPSIQLYADGLHPSVEGAYLSSLVLYAKIIGKDPRSAVTTFRTSTGRLVVITPAVANVLKAAAAEVTGF